MKFNVKSSFCKDSSPSRPSTRSMLLMARLRYSSFLSLLRFSVKIRTLSMVLALNLVKNIHLSPILAIRFDWRSKIRRSRHQFCKCSIFSMFSWCNESSSRVLIRSSLCSDFLRTRSSVTRIRSKIKSFYKELHKNVKKLLTSDHFSSQLFSNEIQIVFQYFYFYLRAINSSAVSLATVYLIKFEYIYEGTYLSKPVASIFNHHKLSKICSNK